MFYINATEELNLCVDVHIHFPSALTHFLNICYISYIVSISTLNLVIVKCPFFKILPPICNTWGSSAIVESCFCWLFSKMVPRNCLDLLLQKVLGAEQKYFKYLNFRLKILVYDNWLGIMPFYKQKLDGFHRKIFKNKSLHLPLSQTKEVANVRGSLLNK